jgi:ribose transport system ATP-binding protein
MLQQADEGRAILFFSTESDELTHMCDRVIVLAGGRISGVIEGPQLNDTTLMRAALTVHDEDE